MLKYFLITVLSRNKSSLHIIDFEMLTEKMDISTVIEASKGLEISINR